MIKIGHRVIDRERLVRDIREYAKHHPSTLSVTRFTRWAYNVEPTGPQHVDIAKIVDSMGLPRLKANRTPKQIKSIEPFQYVFRVNVDQSSVCEVTS
jgi:hypothetical protein